MWTYGVRAECTVWLGLVGDGWWARAGVLQMALGRSKIAALKRCSSQSTTAHCTSKSQRWQRALKSLRRTFPIIVYLLKTLEEQKLFFVSSVF